jgi:hypothetical protein
MSVPDPLAKLRALSKSETGTSPFAHDNEDEILRQLLGVFTQVPTGQELVDKSKSHGTKIKLLKGRNDFSFSPESNTVYVGIPPVQSGAKAQMIIHLAMGLEESRQQFEGMPRPDVAVGRDQFALIHEQKQHAMLLKMCQAAYECINSLGLREMLDELKKLGHIELYEAYEKELRGVS